MWRSALFLKTHKMSKIKLPPVFKKKWLKALRSGEYKQAFGWMVRKEGYCCIGVAGKICGLSDYRLNDSALSGYTEEKIPKIFRMQGSYDNKLPLGIAMAMNDKGKSFKQIANFIEKNL